MWPACLTGGVPALLALWAIGCSLPDLQGREDVVFDLVDQFDSAEVLVETGLVDLGTPPARDHLGPGWSWSETSADGTTFVWSSPRMSRLRFFLTEPRALQARLRCRPFRSRERSVHRLSVRINGEPSGELPLERGWQELELTLPSDRLIPGVNTLSFEPVWTGALPLAGSQVGAREVAVAFDWIRFVPREPAAPTADGPARRMQLTAGSQVDYFLEHSRESHLAIDSVQISDARSPTRFRVTVRSDATEPTVLLEKVRTTKGVRVALPDSETPLRLRVETLGGSVELTAPRVVSSASSRTPNRSDLAPLETQSPRPQPSLVVLYLIDTLRADHLTGFGYQRNTSPSLVKLMEDAVVFDNALAQSSWTKSSVGSILTGLLPWSHGAERLRDAMITNLEIMPEILGREGFRSAAFIANGMIGEPFGFNRGWERFEMMPESLATAADVHRSALSWLDTLDPTSPALLYLHTVEPHTPYDPPPIGEDEMAPQEVDRAVGSVEAMRRLAASTSAPDPSLVSTLIDLYDAEIAAADRELADLIDDLRSRNRFDDTLIVVVSDHGEEFFEHQGWTHGRTLHRESLHVPLIIRFPRGWSAGTRVTTRVQHIDLLPTLLDYLGIETPPELSGSSQLCAIEAAASTVDLDCEGLSPRAIFSGIHYYGNHWVGVVAGDWKLIVDRVDSLDKTVQLFDLVRDSAETDNLAAAYPATAGYLTSLIRGELARNSHRDGSVEVELDRETEKRLEALGYLN